MWEIMCCTSGVKGALTLQAKGCICMWITEKKLTMFITCVSLQMTTSLFALNQAFPILSIIHFVAK